MSSLFRLVQRAKVRFPLALVLAALVLLVATVLTVTAHSPNPFRWPYE
jgi:hypothetical protein